MRGRRRRGELGLGKLGRWRGVELGLRWILQLRRLLLLELGLLLELWLLLVLQLLLQRRLLVVLWEEWLLERDTLHVMGLSLLGYSNGALDAAF